MKKKDYTFLMGFTKRQILSELGEGYNFYPWDNGITNYRENIAWQGSL